MTSDVAAEQCTALGAAEPLIESYQSHEIKLGGLSVYRALPVRGRRLIGPWCFLDRFGPVSFTEGKPMDVGAHPHIGLQTVSWLLEGEIVHHDSLGNEALLRPGGVNIMTTGRGIAHAEQTPRPNTGRLNGVQLWTALPETDRHRGASFHNIVQAPTLSLPGSETRVFSGGLDSVTSAAEHFSPIVGADVSVHAGESTTLPLRKDFEHGLLLLSGDCAFEGQPLAENVLYYLGAGRSEGRLKTAQGARLLLVGGVPFPETILMWWNFVARTPDEIRDARTDWETRQRFGEIPSFHGTRIPSPELMRLAAPHPAS
ncbi:MAG: pirin family protein [Vicinamibacteria bacterium]